MDVDDDLSHVDTTVVMPYLLSDFNAIKAVLAANAEMFLLLACILLCGHFAGKVRKWRRL